MQKAWVRIFLLLRLSALQFIPCCLSRYKAGLRLLRPHWKYAQSLLLSRNASLCAASAQKDLAVRGFVVSSIFLYFLFFLSLLYFPSYRKSLLRKESEDPFDRRALQERQKAERSCEEWWCGDSDGSFVPDMQSLTPAKKATPDPFLTGLDAGTNRTCKKAFKGNPKEAEKSLKDARNGVFCLLMDARIDIKMISSYRIRAESAWIFLNTAYPSAFNAKKTSAATGPDPDPDRWKVPGRSLPFRGWSGRSKRSISLSSLCCAILCFHFILFSRLYNNIILLVFIY